MADVDEAIVNLKMAIGEVDRAREETGEPIPDHIASMIADYHRIRDDERARDYDIRPEVPDPPQVPDRSEVPIYACECCGVAIWIPGWCTRCNDEVVQLVDQSR